MACAHRVNVEPLHQLNVLKHPFRRNHISSVGVKFVAVHTLEQHRFAVYEYLPPGQLYFSEADIHRHHLVAAFHRGCESVKIRSLGRPFHRLCDTHGSCAAF